MQPGAGRPAAVLNRGRMRGVSASAALLLAAVVTGCGRGNAYVAPPPPEVTVTHPSRRAVTSYLEYTGTTQAIERVDVRARVKGFLKERRFQGGERVDAGQLLFVIDEEPFLVQLEQAKAKEAEAEAALRKAEESKARQVASAQLDLDEALLALSRLDESRNKTLYSRNAGSREEVEKSEATRRKNDAQVEADRAHLEQARSDYEINILAAKSSLRAAKAAVRNAEIDLGYCRIQSPIVGEISRSEVDVGNFVGDGQATVLATIVKVDPIRAYFSVSEDDLLRVERRIRQGKSIDYRKATLAIEMGLGDEQGYPRAGKVDYADPSVDPGTGTVRARGVFPNPDGAIKPGLFVRVRLPLERNEDAVLVPDRALGADQGGDYLLVVAAGDLVERRAVRVGAEVDGMRVVEGKVGPADRIVVDGLQRARPGLKVTPKVEAEAAPSVAEGAGASRP